MTNYLYEENVNVLVYLMKAHNIKDVVVSPGTTNMTFVASIQKDPFFHLYSAVDERAAAYIAYGMAKASGEAVALSCTGATASRNYIPALTEAFYAHVPVLAITSTQNLNKIGQNNEQVIDRTKQPNDLVKMSLQLTAIHDDRDRDALIRRTNEALLELNHGIPGPVHINLETTYNMQCSKAPYPGNRVIRRICMGDVFPKIDKKKIAIVVGNHSLFDEDEIKSIDLFCKRHNAVVLCDQTSNYRGQYRVLTQILLRQSRKYSIEDVDLIIDIGKVSGAAIHINTKDVWRVAPDGIIRDSYNKLTYVFEMSEKTFFDKYNITATDESNSFIEMAKKEELSLREKAKGVDLPFSNLWMAQNVINKLPLNSCVHLGIWNSLRAWNYFESDGSISFYSNTGGFGIDGGISSLLGAATVDPEKEYFGVFGDLATFYDLNALFNGYIGRNVHLMVVNNGVGTEFKNYTHPVSKLGKDGDAFLAARGHNGNKSPLLLKDLADSLGFLYLSISDKEQFRDSIDKWISISNDKPVILEIFTDSEDESNALKIMNTLEMDHKKDAQKRFLNSKLGQLLVKVKKKVGA